MKLADIFELGASTVSAAGVALWEGLHRLSADPGDVEPMGNGDVFQSLGVSSRPYPSDDKGKAEGVGLRGIGGRVITWIGARDTRTAAIVGALKPGDTVLHSTGPSQAAQVQCKEEKRQVVMATKDGSGKTMVVNLDGKNNKLQIVLRGMIFEMNGNDGSFTMTNGQAAIMMQGKSIILDGTCVIGGKVPDPTNRVVVAPAALAPPTITPPGAPNGTALIAMSAPEVFIALPSPV